MVGFTAPSAHFQVEEQDIVWKDVSPDQTAIATPQRNISQKCNIVGPAFASSSQMIATFERRATDRNSVGRNMLHAFGHPVATCCDMLNIENRTSAHAQDCGTNLAKSLQHHATSTNVAWKVWLFSSLSQQHPTCRSTSQQDGQTVATYCTQQCCDMLRWNVAIVWPGL